MQQVQTNDGVRVRKNFVGTCNLSCGRVQDGALWLQGFVDLHCPEAARILDFPHAVGYLHAIEETHGPDGRLLSARENGNRMLALRTAAGNDCWAEVWGQIEVEQRRQVGRGCGAAPAAGSRGRSSHS